MREDLPELVPGITLPILVVAGDASPLGDGPPSQARYDAAGSADKQTRRYPALFHEIFSEPEHPQVLADLTNWLEAHL